MTSSALDNQELYRSQDVLVRYVRPKASQDFFPDSLVVVFGGYTDLRALDRRGFCEEFLAVKGIRALHIINRDNDWYQYQEMPEVLAAVRLATAFARNVLSFGSEMGAYAAIRFADQAGATTVLALSPQYSIDPSRMPHEYRWAQDSQRIQFLPTIDGRICTRIVPHVVFDPVSLDLRHAHRIAADAPITTISLRGAGHPVGTVLSELGLLESVIVGAMTGILDPDDIERRYRAARLGSASIVANLAERQPPHRGKLALRLARRAEEMAPTSDVVLLTLGRCLMEQGRHAESVEVLGRAVNHSGRHPGYLYTFSLALELAGDRDGAIEVAEEHLAACPEVAHCHAWLANLLFRSGRQTEAYHHANRAVALDPRTLSVLAKIGSRPF